jgi:hypothetical protein
MKRIIRLVVLLKGQNGMKTMKSFLIASMVLGTILFATINVVLNEKTPIVSNLTLKNLEAFTDEAGECPPPYNASELLNGCKANNTVPDLNSHGTGTITFSCSPGQNLTCTYGTLQVVQYVIKSGQVLSTFTCFSVIVL